MYAVFFIMVLLISFQYSKDICFLTWALLLKSMVCMDMALHMYVKSYSQR